MQQQDEVATEQSVSRITMSAHPKSTSSAASITVSSTHIFRATFVVLGALCICLWSVDLYVKIPSVAKNVKFAFNPERSRRLNPGLNAAAGAGDGAVATPATNDAVPSTLCNVWGCTCQGFSDTFQTWPMHWGEASKNSKAKEWWISARCTTKPAAGDENERGGGSSGGGSQPVQKSPPSTLQPRAPDVVSILTFSNGQPYCNENALLNGMYQRRPDGVSTIELVMFETSDEPSTQWREWERLYAGPPFKVVYRWYNGSLPRGKSNPVLGALRNEAGKTATGSIMINMDNDDVYSPDFVAYILHHIHENGWSQITVKSHSSAQFNPDGTLILTKLNDGRSIGAHMWSYTDEVLRKNCWYRELTMTEENGFLQCIDRNGLLKGAVNMTNGPLGNPYLLIKVNSPLSITNQKFFVNRQLWNRLTPDDIENIINAMRKFYRDVHTLQKPPEIPAYGPAAADYPNSPWVLPGVQGWSDFHKRHPEFTSQTNYPQCTGFAGMVGQVFEPIPGKGVGASGYASSIVEQAVDAKACCRRCASMFDSAIARGANVYSDDVHRGYCGAFSYNRKTKSCVLGWGRHVYAPWLWDTWETGARISPACPKCGTGLKPDPTLSPKKE